VADRSGTALVDIVIPAYNGWSLTRKCLEHLACQTADHRVILCDNGSTDGTPQRLRESFPAVDVIELGANLGFAAACNRGVRAGTSGVVVLLNNDVLCGREFVEHLVAPLFADDRLGSSAALLLQEGERSIESFGLAVDATLAGYPRLRNCAAGEAQADHPTLVGASGAAGAYRRRAWHEVGGLDEGVFAYGEDVDLALRLRASGWPTAAAADAVAVHLGSATAVARSAAQRYSGGYSRGYFIRRYGVLRRRVALRALATEAIAVAGDALVYSHDLAALRGRIAGWRAASGQPRQPYPPDDAIDRTITFAESLRLRRSIYRCT
jgi:N-acetylglucosaminyl-diphospho-decaprenol L-rhamnosyltransferase